MYVVGTCMYLPTAKVLGRNGFYEPRARTHAGSNGALTPRVNGGLNSTVTPENTSGRDTRDSFYGFREKRLFPSQGPAA